MKALCVFDNSFRLYADSSIHHNNMPTFLPDIDGGWTANLCTAVRLCRLGTHIPLQFAHRYYDAISVAAMFVPTMQLGSLPALDERFYAMDSAYAVGEWYQVSDADLTHTVGTPDARVDISAVIARIDRDITQLSQYMTFKMGDILIYPAPSVALPIAENDRLTAMFDGKECLKLKIK